MRPGSWIASAVTVLVAAFLTSVSAWSPSARSQENGPGFRMNVGVMEADERIGRLTISSLAVGEVGLVDYPTLCSHDGVLKISGLAGLEEDLKWGTGFEVKRLSGGNVEIAAIRGGNSAPWRGADRTAASKISSVSSCDYLFRDDRLKEIPLFTVVSVNGHASLEDLLTAAHGGSSQEPEGKRPARASPPTGTVPWGDEAGWEVSRGKSKIDDSPTIVLRRESESMFPEKAVMIIRCKEDTTAIYLIFNDYLGSKAPPLTVRVGDDKAETLRWAISSDRKALGLWNGSVSIPFLRRIVDADRVVVRVTPYNDSPRTETFVLDGLREPLAELAETCNWSLERNEKVEAPRPAPTMPAADTMKPEQGKKDDFLATLKSVQDLKSGKAATSGRLSEAELATVRKQVAGCWLVPAGTKNADDLQVEIDVTMNSDRTVRFAKVVDQDRLISDPFFRSAAESALRALKSPSCSPLNLPAGRPDAWKTFRITFDSKDMLS